MRIGVTGGSGFIGSHIVDKLLEKEHEVRIIDVVKPHRTDIEMTKTDLLDYDSVLHATEGLDCVFHLAAVSNVNEAYKNPVHCVKLNTVGTVNVLEAARHNDIERVIFASTDWVYGGARSDAVDEESPFFMPGAGHIYTSTKIASEFYLHDYQTLYGLDSTILRYGIPYGPRSRVGTVMPIFVKKALNNEPLTIFGDGSQFRNFIYVEDLAEGNVAALKPVAKNKTYNLEGMRPISVKEVAETIRNILQKDVEIRYEQARPGDYGGKTISSRKARDELGWEPKVDFEEGMRRYVEWYRCTFG